MRCSPLADEDVLLRCDELMDGESEDEGDGEMRELLAPHDDFSDTAMSEADCVGATPEELEEEVDEDDKIED